MGLFDFVSGKVTPEKFGEIVVKELRERGEQRPIVHDAENRLLGFVARQRMRGA